MQAKGLKTGLGLGWPLPAFHGKWANPNILVPHWIAENSMISVPVITVVLRSWPVVLPHIHQRKFWLGSRLQRVVKITNLQERSQLRWTYKKSKCS